MALWSWKAYSSYCSFTICDGVVYWQSYTHRATCPVQCCSASSRSNEVVATNRRQDDLLDLRIACADCIECSHERVTWTNLVVPIRSNDHQVANSRMDKKVFEEVQCR